MTISTDDPRPPYAQVADHLLLAIEAGEYPLGARLPSGRDLAKQFGVALGTVQHAVNDLKSRGVLVSHPPRGVFVKSTTGATAPPPSAEYLEITQHLAALQQSVQQLGERLEHVEHLMQRNPAGDPDQASPAGS